MKTAFLFAGQGQQFEGMGRDIAGEYKVAADIYESASSILGYDILQLSAEAINQTKFTQPAMLTINQALYEIMKENSILPTVTAGLSLGEYNALLAAGVLSFADAVGLIAKRAVIMTEATIPGTTGMAAVLKMDMEKVEEILKQQEFQGKVAICNINSHEQIVVGGELEALGKAVEMIKEAGARRVVPLAVSTVSHMSLLKQASEKMKVELEQCSFKTPEVDFINNVEAVVQNEGFVDTLSRQICEPTKMYPTILRMLDMGVDTIVEIGPKGSLSGFVRAIAKKSEKEVAIYNVYDSSTLQETLEKIK